MRYAALGEVVQPLRLLKSCEPGVMAWLGKNSHVTMRTKDAG
jgi:hypothetical protein